MADPVDVRDLGIGKLRDDVAELKSRRITVGWHGESGAEQHPNAQPGTTVAEIAAMQEFGTTRAPARPMVRVALDHYRDRVREATRRAMRDLIAGRASLDAAQQTIGEAVLEALRNTILDAKRWAEPLAPRTVSAKGHADPLIESGTLYDRASWAARRGKTILRQGGEQ